MATILIVDDDQRLLRMLQRTLGYEGLDVVTATNGRQALELVQREHIDLIVLDWMMPAVDGIAVVRQMRDAGDETPILMLTARDAIENRVKGLESGADDYLIKPFAPAELVARVRALLRRAGPGQQSVLKYAGLVLDPDTREVSRDGEPFQLTPTEFDLLYLFLQHPRQVLERALILRRVWGYDFEGDDNVLDVYVGYLRRKMERNGKPRLIQTVRGVGYALREQA